MAGNWPLSMARKTCVGKDTPSALSRQGNKGSWSNMFLKRRQCLRLSPFQHVEGTREGEFAEDVDDEEGDPGFEVDGLAGGGGRVEAREELRQTAVDVRLHLRHGLEGEARGEGLLPGRVDVLVSRPEDVGTEGCEGVVEGALLGSAAGMAMCIDVEVYLFTNDFPVR